VAALQGVDRGAWQLCASGTSADIGFAVQLEELYAGELQRRKELAMSIALNDMLSALGLETSGAASFCSCSHSRVPAAPGPFRSRITRTRIRTCRMVCSNTKP
jgi:hypothetical protein